VPTLRDFLSYWEAGEHGKMYELVSRVSKQSISRWDFLRTLEDAEAEFSIIDFSIGISHTSGDRAVSEHTLTIKWLFGEQVTLERTARFRREGGTGDWSWRGNRVDWDSYQMRADR